MKSRLLLLNCAACLALCAEGSFTWRDVNGTGMELLENGQPVFVYNYGMILREGNPEASRRSTYLHPVYLPDGTVITDDFNPDHPHHRGISWMWPVVVVNGKTYDLWTVGGIREKFVQWTAREAQAGGARLGVENGWYAGEKRAIKENVEIRVDSARGGVRHLDFVLQFEPIGEDVEIAGTPDAKKGFGGFCFRFAPRDEKKTVIRTDKGLSTKDGVLEKHAWAQVEGTFKGHPGGARIDEDPSNPGAPNGWLIRFGFGFLNPSYPGLEHLTLKKGAPLVLKYRVTLFAGTKPAS